MQKNILFDLTTKLVLKDGASMEEIVDSLQKFTQYPLYIKHMDMTLRSIEDFSVFPKGEFELVGVETGYMLRHKITYETFHVFDRDFMEYLIGFNSEIYEERFETPSSTSYDETISSDSFHPVEEAINIIEEIMKRRPNTPVTELTSTEEDSSITESEASVSDEEESSEWSIDSCVNKTWFRMLLKDCDDEDEESMYLNSKTLSMIEYENELDIEETIKLSFQTFLENRNYENVDVKLGYHENVFAEIEIETSKPLSETDINEIEDEALLQLVGPDIIFFIFRESEEIFENELVDILNMEDGMIEIIDEEEADNIFASEVPLFKLPDSLVSEVMERVDFLNYEGKLLLFDYEDFQFGIKRESNNMYSVFDLDSMFFDIPHLHPNKYQQVHDYYALPIAQFSYIA